MHAGLIDDQAAQLTRLKQKKGRDTGKLHTY